MDEIPQNTREKKKVGPARLRLWLVLLSINILMTIAFIASELFWTFMKLLSSPAMLNILFFIIPSICILRKEIRSAAELFRRVGSEKAVDPKTMASHGYWELDSLSKPVIYHSLFYLHDAEQTIDMVAEHITDCRKPRLRRRRSMPSMFVEGDRKIKLHFRKKNAEEFVEETEPGQDGWREKIYEVVWAVCAVIFGEGPPEKRKSYFIRDATTKDMNRQVRRISSLPDGLRLQYKRKAAAGSAVKIKKHENRREPLNQPPSAQPRKEQGRAPLSNIVNTSGLSGYTNDYSTAWPAIPIRNVLGRTELKSKVDRQEEERPPSTSVRTRARSMEIPETTFSPMNLQKPKSEMMRKCSVCDLSDQPVSVMVPTPDIKTPPNTPSVLKSRSPYSSASSSPKKVRFASPLDDVPSAVDEADSWSSESSPSPDEIPSDILRHLIPEETSENSVHLNEEIDEMAEMLNKVCVKLVRVDRHLEETQGTRMSLARELVPEVYRVGRMVRAFAREQM